MNSAVGEPGVCSHISQSCGAAIADPPENTAVNAASVAIRLFTPYFPLVPPAGCRRVKLIMRDLP